MILETLQDSCAELAKQFNFSFQDINSLLSEFRSELNNGHSEQDFYEIAAILLKSAVGDEVGNHDGAISIMARYIVKVNAALDRELSRYNLTW